MVMLTGNFTRDRRLRKTIRGQTCAKTDDFTQSNGVTVQWRQLHEIIYLAAPKISDPQILGL